MLNSRVVNATGDGEIKYFSPTPDTSAVNPKEIKVLGVIILPAEYPVIAITFCLDGKEVLKYITPSALWCAVENYEKECVRYVNIKAPDNSSGPL